MYDDMCQTNDIPEVKETIVMLRQLSADEKVRQEAYYREKRLHDEATAMKKSVRRLITVKSGCMTKQLHSEPQDEKE